MSNPYAVMFNGSNNNKMTQEKNKPKINLFTSDDQLLLHQLRLLEWQSNKISIEKNEEKEGQQQNADAIPKPSRLPEKWCLTNSVSLYPWQTECIENWFKNEFQGTVKVVTGGGKTILALAIIERLQNSKLADLRIAIIVPTIVLMNQWYEELITRSNLPPAYIAKLGGGYKEDFSKDRCILICVLASAHKELPKIVKKAGIGQKLFIIADECHRLGAQQMSHVFKTERAFNLGLSATPERNENEDDNLLSNYDNSILGRELGKIIYDFNLSNALMLGIIPAFTINHYGLYLNHEERILYDRLSRSITEGRSELQNHAPKGCSSGNAFFKWVNNAAIRNKGSLGKLAKHYISETSRRKALLYKMNSRTEAVECLIRNEFDINPDARVILFHENIKEVMNLFIRLNDKKFPVVAEHSELPDSIRETGLDLFRKGIAQIIVSARSLIEGFNVPAIDVGIIVASSSSVRQRIQSLGRVLRKHRTSKGEDKTSCIHILYAHNTVDDAVYSKEEWDKITGIDCNKYFLWNLKDSPQLQDGPPKKPLPSDIDVDFRELKPGCRYPGKYEGEEFRYDTNRNIRKNNGQFVKNPGTIIEEIQRVKKGIGSLKVTPQCNYILVLFHDGKEWTTRFVSKLEKPFEYWAYNSQEPPSNKEIEAWISKAALSDLYKFQTVPIAFSVKYKTSRGRNIISKKIKRGEVFARTKENANDPLMGKDADSLIGIIKELRNRGNSVIKFEINNNNHVLYRQGGVFYFVYALKKGLEFPE